MRDHTPIRTRMKAWRTAVAVAGVAALAVTLGQSVSTLANPNEVVSTDGSQIATGNFFPTPLTASVNCTTTGTDAWLPGKRAQVSWQPVPGATGYRLELVDWGSNGNGTNVVRTIEVDATTTVVGDITAVIGGTRYQLWPRVRTVNGPAISSGYVTPAKRISYKSISTSRTECENTSPPSAPNDGWENTTVWNPALPAPASAAQQTVIAAQRSVPEVDVEQPDDGVEVITGAGEETSVETPVSTAKESSEAASPSSATSTTTRPPATPRSTLTTALRPPATTQSSTTTKSTSVSTPANSPSSTPSTVTSKAQPPNTEVRLPGGGEATIVDDATLVVFGTGAPQCSVTLRPGSKLGVRDGVLEVTDAIETRAVNLETCQLT